MWLLIFIFLQEIIVWSTLRGDLGVLWMLSGWETADANISALFYFLSAEDLIDKNVSDVNIFPNTLLFSNFVLIFPIAFTQKNNLRKKNKYSRNSRKFIHVNINTSKAVTLAMDIDRKWMAFKIEVVVEKSIKQELIDLLWK